MVGGIPPPEERRRLGRVTPGSPLWWKRYNSLKADGFNHDEAAQLSEGIISSPDMLRGRRARRQWYKGVVARGLTPAEIEEAIDDMYDEFDWWDAYTQFYPVET